MISRPGKDSADALLGGRPVAMMYVVSRRHSMFDTYWTNPRSVEVMDNSHAVGDDPVRATGIVGGFARWLAAMAGGQR